MNEVTRKTLEVFVEMSDRLTDEEFTRFLQEIGSQLSYSYEKKTQNIKVETIAPTETMNRSFLITYRMFLQGSEHMRIIDPKKPVSSELLDSSLSYQWLEQLKDVTNKIHNFLLSKPSGQIVINHLKQNGEIFTEILTRWDILETLVYGDYAHLSQRDRLNSWLSNPNGPLLKAFLMMELQTVLIYTLGGIHHLANYARIELGISPSLK